MWFVMGAIGALIDVIFITTLYNAKFKINKYPLLIIISVFITLASCFLPQTIISKLLLIVAQCLFWRFWCKTDKMQYFIVPALILGFFSFIVITNISDGFLMWIIIIFTEIISIVAVYEDVHFRIKFNLTTITLKILTLITVLSIILLSKSYYFTR